MLFQYDSSSFTLVNGANSSGTRVGPGRMQKMGSSADASWSSGREITAWRGVCSSWIKSSCLSTAWPENLGVMTALEGNPPPHCPGVKLYCCKQSVNLYSCSRLYPIPEVEIKAVTAWLSM